MPFFVALRLSIFTVLFANVSHAWPETHSGVSGRVYENAGWQESYQSRSLMFNLEGFWPKKQGAVPNGVNIEISRAISKHYAKVNESSGKTVLAYHPIADAKDIDAKLQSLMTVLINYRKFLAENCTGVGNENSDALAALLDHFVNRIETKPLSGNALIIRSDVFYEMAYQLRKYFSIKRNKSGNSKSDVGLWTAIDELGTLFGVNMSEQAKSDWRDGYREETFVTEMVEAGGTARFLLRNKTSHACSTPN